MLNVLCHIEKFPSRRETHWISTNVSRIGRHLFRSVFIKIPPSLSFYSNAKWISTLKIRCINIQRFIFSWKGIHNSRKFYLTLKQMIYTFFALVTNKTPTISTFNLYKFFRNIYHRLFLKIKKNINQILDINKFNFNIKYSFFTPYSNFNELTNPSYILNTISL